MLNNPLPPTKKIIAVDFVLMGVKAMAILHSIPCLQRWFSESVRSLVEISEHINTTYIKTHPHISFIYIYIYIKNIICSSKFFKTKQHFSTFTAASPLHRWHPSCLRSGRPGRSQPRSAGGSVLQAMPVVLGKDTELFLKTWDDVGDPLWTIGSEIFGVVTPNQKRKHDNISHYIYIYICVCMSVCMS